MSAYDNDPRVTLDTEYLPGSYMVERSWRVMAEDGGPWHAFLLGEWGECVGNPIGGPAAGAATADEAIRSLIGEPQ